MPDTCALICSMLSAARRVPCSCSTVASESVRHTGPSALARASRPSAEPATRAIVARSASTMPSNERASSPSSSSDSKVGAGRRSPEASRSAAARRIATGIEMSRATHQARMHREQPPTSPRAWRAAAAKRCRARRGRTPRPRRPRPCRRRACATSRSRPRAATLLRRCCSATAARATCCATAAGSSAIGAVERDERHGNRHRLRREALLELAAICCASASAGRSASTRCVQLLRERLERARALIERDQHREQHRHQAGARQRHEQLRADRQRAVRAGAAPPGRPRRGRAHRARAPNSPPLTR